MPRASGADVKRWLQDHDSDVVDESPPILNTWYEVFHAQDVRLIWCQFVQENDETANKDIEVRWTIDGTVYLLTQDATSATSYTAYRDWLPSTGGTLGLSAVVGSYNASKNVDKRGLDFKVEVRITSVVGTNQQLICRCVRETLELT